MSEHFPLVVLDNTAVVPSQNEVIISPDYVFDVDSFKQLPLPLEKESMSYQQFCDYLDRKIMEAFGIRQK